VSDAHLVSTVVADGRLRLDAYSAVDVADLLLGILLARRAAAALIEPASAAGAVHALQVERGRSVATVATMRPALADAVVARLAILADLTVGGPGSQLGRLRARLSGEREPTDLLVAVRETTRGLSAEVRRLFGPGDATPVAPASPAPPASIDDTYRIEGELGSGGMATVYRATHVVLEKAVAIKVLHPELASNPTLAAQFVVEARAACRARHPAIVDVTDFGRFHDGRACIVMELVDAPTLATVLRGGPLEVGRALGVARQIASALAAAGTQGVVHRDLKPANVFVGEGDTVKIADFGVACVLPVERGADGAGASLGSDDALASAIVGTAPYMSPEQILGEAVDPRADVFSLGCVLFEMLTGRVPFAGRTLSAILYAQSKGPVLDAQDAARAVPAPLHGILTRALAARRDDRYASAAELEADLAAASAALTPVGWRRWRR